MAAVVSFSVPLDSQTPKTYIPAFKAFNWKKERFIRTDQIKMASFSVVHENG